MGNQNNIIVSPASVKIDNVDVGYTQGGVSLRKANEFFDVDADQLGGVARKVQTFERMFLTTTMLEATVDNMLSAMNEPASNETSNGSALHFGQGDPEAQEHVLTITGKGPSGKTRTYTFFRAISVDEVSHMIGARDQASVVPVGFELLKDPSNSDRFGNFADT